MRTTQMILITTEWINQTEQRAGGFDVAAPVESARMQAVGTTGPEGAGTFTGEFTGVGTMTGEFTVVGASTGVARGA